MPTVAMVEYDQATPEVRGDLRRDHGGQGHRLRAQFLEDPGQSIRRCWREVWRGLDEAMAPGRLDALTKEMVALAVSATNGCTYCIRSHTAAARKLGMDDAMLGELMAVVGTFNQTNRLADGYQVEVDVQLMRRPRAAPAQRPAGPAGRGRAGRRAARRNARPRPRSPQPAPPAMRPQAPHREQRAADPAPCRPARAPRAPPTGAARHRR